MLNMMNRKRILPTLGFPILALILFFSISTSWGHIPEGTEQVLEGRMTGGGSIFTDSGDFFSADFPKPSAVFTVIPGVRLTHGFELHCNLASTPNNLEVNIHLPNGQSGRFHLDQYVFVQCWDDEFVDPRPPAAPFDTMYGQGIGSFNGEAGFCADWEFTDAGEPGSNDRIRSFRVWKPSASNPPTAPCAEGTFVFSIFEPPNTVGGHTLTFGNHQAHKGNK